MFLNSRETALNSFLFYFYLLIKKKTIFGSGNLVWILRNSYNFISCMVDVKKVSVVLY
jgi:hypothetical protein